MRINNFFYCLRRGIANTFRNPLFTFASVATIAACIFLFGFFFSIFTNINNIVKEAENTIGITVFFDEDATDEMKEAIKTEISQKGNIKYIKYISAEDAWSEFKENYFGDQAEELSGAFADDNPLADSDSYEIYMNNIEDQQSMAEFISGLKGVREVNYSSALIGGLKGLNRLLSVLFSVIIALLLAVSIFLISNTINVTAAFRKRENEIMRYIGATNFMIRSPFVVEGILLGFFGSLIPVAGIYLLYSRADAYMKERFLSGATDTITDLFTLLPASVIMPKIAAGGIALGVGMGFIVSFVTIRKHLKV